MRPNSPRFSRVKSRLILSSVDKWLTKICIKKTVSIENQSLTVIIGAQNRHITYFWGENKGIQAKAKAH